MDGFEQFDHPAWVTMAGTAVGYGLILAGFFLLLFVLPFLAYAGLV
ncbi:MAG: hypothetical protein ABEJ40_12040 [Haloarculaceae archaeon]